MRLRPPGRRPRLGEVARGEPPRGNIKKPSELCKAVRQVWDKDVPRTRLPAEGFKLIDDAIAKLEAAGR